MAPMMVCVPVASPGACVEFSAKFSVPLTLPVPVSVARYSVDGAKMGRKTAAMLLDVIRHGTGKIRSVENLPQFVNGKTVGGAANQ